MNRLVAWLRSTLLIGPIQAWAADQAWQHRLAESEARAKERAPAGPPVPPPVAPTVQELAAEAKRRYEERVKMLDAVGLDEIEQEAARREAKRRYLKELGELLK